MPKASTSSASSGTRKKHARKAAGPPQEVSQSLQKANPKPSKKEIKKGFAPPPKKSYIAPSKLKPTPVDVDPLDSLGLVTVLPADLVVVLRRLAKKDGVTKTRALEELTVLVDKARRENKHEEDLESVDGSVNLLVTVLPVWLHRYPALSVHPSRRIRHLSALMHASLLSVSTLRDVILSFLLETGSETHVSHVLGVWCLSAWDIDRGVASVASKSWKEVVDTRLNGNESTEGSEKNRFILTDSSLARTLLPFVLTTVMDPESTYASLNLSHSVLGREPPASHAGLHRGPSSHEVIPPSSGGGNNKSTKSLSMTPPRGEDDIESAEDRNARLRVGAMGVLKWIFDTFTPTTPLNDTLCWLLSSPLFWSVLHHAAQPQFLQAFNRRSGAVGAIYPHVPDSFRGFGFRQTIVRRAGWGIVHSVVGSSGKGPVGSNWIDNLSEATITLLSSAILRSAFVEPDPMVRSKMWEPLLLFLANHNNAWILDLYFEHAKGQEENTDDSRPQLSATENNMCSGYPFDGPANEVASPPSSVAFAEFLAFLSLGCNGSPVQGYPNVLVILSTIPKEILSLSLPALSEFFDSLWAAVDGNVLSTLAPDRVESIDVFLGTWGECLLWTSRKLIEGVPTPPKRDPTVQDIELNSSDSVDAFGRDSKIIVSRALIELEFGRLVGQLGKELRVSTSVTGRRVAVVLWKLELVTLDLSELAWPHITRFVRDTTTTSEDPVGGKYALEFLATLYEHLPPECLSKMKVERLVVDIATRIASEWLDPRNKEPALVNTTLNVKVLEGLMARFGPMLDRDENFVKHIDELVQTNLTFLLSQPSLILSYLTLRSDSTHAVTTWRLLLSALGSSADLDFNTRLRALWVFLDTVPVDGSASWAKPRGGELDRLVGDALSKALDGDVAMQALIEKFIKRADAFLDTVDALNIVSTIVDTIETHAQYLCQNTSHPIKVLCRSLDLLLVVEQEAPTIAYHPSVPLIEVMPSIFLLAFVMPQCSPIEEEEYALEISRQVWETWQQAADEKARQTVSEKVKNSLKSLIMNTDARPSPAALLRVFTHINAYAEYVTLSDIIPSHSELDALLSSMHAFPIDKALSITDILVPTSGDSRPFSRLSCNYNFDRLGLSPYARGVSCLLYALTSDRQFARKNLWALYHVLTLAQFISEVLQVPKADSPVFQLNLKESRVKAGDILRQTQQIAAFLLISPGDENWHKNVVGVLAGKGLQSENLDSTGIFVKVALEASLARGTVRDSIVLHRVLQYVLRSATVDDADQWIELARSLDEKALQTSLAISLAVTEFAPDSQRLDRYRNELASKLSGIPSMQANSIGLRSLCRLVAVAPNPGSDVVFLPQQRAVHLVQTFQTWMASDEDLSESVESEVTLILFYLAPILQNVQGSHWEFMLAMLESNLENSTFNDVSSLVLLSRSLRLSTRIRDLSVSSKYLRRLWGERSKIILVMVRDLLAANTGKTRPSQPRALCREQALSIIQDLPYSLMDENTLSVMCHLVADPSVNFQKMAYQLLRQAAIKRTEFLNIEAGVNPDATVIQLPTELLALLQNRLDAEPGGMDASSPDPLANLLCWMILFDLFDDASLKVKVAYVEQMRNLDIIGDYFLPLVFETLGLEDGSQKSFKLDAWCVDEFWTVFYDADMPQSLRLLAAHLYYRALLTIPSLIRTWWDGLKNRQLLTAVTSFTSSHFSPVLIASELALVKASLSAPVSEEESLTDESFNVKVSHAVHEVAAIFNVDDQQVEIGVRLPVEYPLRAIEVRDIRRVGVPEKLWRKWLFAVQHVVTSQNGHLVDALNLFRKYVSLHFDDQVECAICYSIISIIDRSLPAKPCKTCKNRFHSSCLYKWFNTSHSSSCPLCRSDIM